MSPLPLHTFTDVSLAQLALTHCSFGQPNNERLEWLGDALLEFEVSVLVYVRFGHIAEGGLSLIRSRLVNNTALAAVARRIDLSSHIRIGQADIKDGRDNDNIIASAMEAYLAAIYLDGGDVRTLLTDLLEDDLAAIDEIIRRDGVRMLRDAKSLLQEFLQQRGLPPPVYTLLKTAVVNRQQMLFVECRATKKYAAQASAITRLAAETEAASLCLNQLIHQQ